MLEVGLESLWADTVARLESELSTPSIETWVRQVFPLSLEDGVLELAVPSDFVRQIIASRYTGLLRDVLAKSAGRPIDVHLILTPKSSETVYNEKPVPVPISVTQESRPPVNKEPSETTESEFHTRLNPKYVFEAFVVGVSNRFAHAACQAVAEMPARAYNPLFLYGGVGLGKTHLMHAIGHHVLAGSPKARVLYVSSENFTNEMINAIRDDKMVRFRQRYRNIDVLLIDDIQFVAGKERTQEEFFHTFEALHGAHKQIVISSDRPPKDIPTLEERLRSRFEWGLITDIQPPDLETRIAILAKKAQLEDLSVPDSVLQFIATRIDTNIRELEGALIRVMAYGSITRQPLTAELAMEALKDVIPNSRPKPITIRLIQEEVAKHFDLRVEDLKAKKRTRTVAFPRQVAMYMARQLTDSSLPRIGEEFGGRDHTTVIHACEKIEQERHTDTQLAQLLEALTKRIKSR
ncbi:chromosomal replication initiator protein DnaA [Sulfobacillus thermosulfidooxidans]|uniref:Chromosomal replication initiator protein DnaA n=2 Tax=Sulfobacillus thermosulfidooxidans TaxID=28034 RepID=A0A1W1WBB1_SULTA|nr:chromosomal replication initiator protein DnaA [Sulfobacillus thermosulfidooxidans]OLZ08981.1 chromosomal replication initiation protein DnaA [Sulfobacillus thermosulfidooxidans]OLZ14167.1 chromosomal replication initiation protein DnaA [Sulfobacillus thermosulfidooxidans]OLZ18910.1 chromosomal replication initiation protein DnaA [Sulfobacillus thermosulfidooxidans]PSR27946.1 MAG: chromosomal replication initiator protein DnaA [Sulfobacillus thermosulfidooxidans]SMC03566.1 chromosomal repli